MSMVKLLRATFALVAPLLLWGCVLTPGKFVSTLAINADRTFTFAYKGEVIALDPSAAMKMKGDSGDHKEGEPEPSKADAPDSEADNEAKNREIAAALSKEAGYRSVVYRGKGKFEIDYVMSGTLTHSFLFPFNVDAQAILPFVMVEVRQNGSLRVRAPGFSGNQSGSAVPGIGSMGNSASDGSKYLDGVFTLDTDAEIVSQNNEDGSKTVGRRKQIIWRATPLTKDAPTAVLRPKS